MAAYTLRRIAEVKDMDVADLCDAVTATAARLFGPW
jgi:Tat protein secretion system quality control protein TatD with DNase activity